MSVIMSTPRMVAMPSRRVIRVIVSLWLLLLLSSVPPTTPDWEADDEYHKYASLELSFCPAPHGFVRRLQKKSRDSLDDYPCTLYMANSTIPNAGLGLFSTVPLQVGDRLGHGDLMLPLIDTWLHNADLAGSSPFLDYVWSSRGHIALESFFPDNVPALRREGFLYLHDYQTEGGVAVLGYGMEAAINCHLALSNVGHSTTHYYNGQLGYEDSEDELLLPGTGASSPYTSGWSWVTYHVPAGGEIFKYYGDAWFVQRQDQLGLLPLSEDYAIADDLIQGFNKLLLHYSTAGTAKKYSEELKFDLWNVMIQALGSSRLEKTLPTDPSRIKVAVERGIWEAHQLDAVRSIGELERTGRCVGDSVISHGPSTLPHAGLGAFATRPFQEGSIITGSPLLHINGTDFFAMNEDVYSWHRNQSLLEENQNMLSPLNDTTIRTYQILLNYCWKHPASDVLLCPYGSRVNYINHNKTLANVKVEWAPHGVMGHNTFVLSQDLALGLFSSKKPKLAFDYIATRDINVGDELFLDYSDEFQAAWEDHIRKWKSETMKHNERHKASSWHWNLKYAHAELRTEREQQQEPYPDNVRFWCHMDVTSIQVIFAAPFNSHLYHWTLEGKGIPCVVLNRWRDTRRGQVLYRVGLDGMYSSKQVGFDSYSVGAFQNVSCVEFDYIVRDAIRFVDKTHTSTLHREGTFRHPIGVPDEVFPDTWRNIQSKSNE